MKKLTQAILTVSSGLLVVASGAQAGAIGNQTGNVSLSPGMAYVAFANKRHLDNAAMGTLTLGYNFTDNWGVEAMAGILNSEVDKEFKKDVDGEFYSFNGVYHFNVGHKWQPYVLAGLGVWHLNPNGTVTTDDTGGVDAHTQANANAGLGVQYFFAPNLAWRLGARDAYTFTGGKNDVMVEGGLTILFGSHGPSYRERMQAANQAMPGNTVHKVVAQSSHCAGDLGAVHFKNDSAKIQQSAELNHAVKCLQNHPGLKAQLNGYASKPGAQHYNIKLSAQRAQAVKNYLLKAAKVNKKQITTQAYGSTHFVASNQGESGQAANRRVEIVS